LKLSSHDVEPIHVTSLNHGRNILSIFETFFGKNLKKFNNSYILVIFYTSYHLPAHMAEWCPRPLCRFFKGLERLLSLFPARGEGQGKEGEMRRGSPE
jgi:hypothetical protein